MDDIPTTSQPLRAVADLLATVADPVVRQAMRDAYEERAAICEYDGGLTRAEAEGIAYTDLVYQIESLAMF